jgi:hypothetical protein
MAQDGKGPENERMCRRFTNRLTWREIVALYRLTVPASPERNLPARYNICPTHPERLRAEVAQFINQATPPVTNAPKALVAPHAGYLYSGGVTAAAFATLRDAAQAIEHVVVVERSHHVPVRGIAIPTTDTFETPLGPVPVHREALVRRPGRESLPCAKDRNVRSYVQDLFEPSDRNHLGPGLLHKVPRDIYLGWVRNSPAKRAEYVMEWLPIVTAEGDGKLTWHPDLVAYVEEFGNQPGVLSVLARRMHPKSVWGSVVPNLEPFLPLLESWVKSHKKTEVRKIPAPNAKYQEIC